MLGALVALALPARAVEVRYEGTGCPLPTNVVLTLTRELTRLIQSHQALFRKPPPKDFKITYQVSRTHAEYAHLAEAAGHPADAVAGFAQARQRRQLEPKPAIVSAETRIITWRQASTNDLIAVLLHETTHAVTGAFVGRAPLWFMEGSAELLGTPAASCHKLQRQDEAARWDELEELLTKRELPPLRRFLQADSCAQWDELFQGQRGRAYTASYSLFHLFSAQPRISPFLTSLIDSSVMTEAAEPAQAFAEHVERHWPGGVATLEKGWHSWIRAKAREQRARGKSPKPDGSR
jgi:hypothetical protein